MQNGRQLALKISANSVYGFTGASTPPPPPPAPSHPFPLPFPPYPIH